jgi:hypothetical protein
MEFFTFPTVPFGMLYCLLIISQIAGVFCSATSHDIPRACGWCSSYERHLKRSLCEYLG